MFTLDKRSLEKNVHQQSIFVAGLKSLIRVKGVDSGQMMSLITLRFGSR